MSNIISGNETKDTLVLANMCIAFAVLSEYSPENSRPYLIVAATAMALIALYPLYLLLQKPRRYRIRKETEGDNIYYIIRYKGYLWWQYVTNSDGKILAFKNKEDAVKYVNDNVVMTIVNKKMNRKKIVRKSEVVFDSKKQSKKDGMTTNDANNHKKDNPPASTVENNDNEKNDVDSTIDFFNAKSQQQNDSADEEKGNDNKATADGNEEPDIDQDNQNDDADDENENNKDITEGNETEDETETGNDVLNSHEENSDDSHQLANRKEDISEALNVAWYNYDNAFENKDSKKENKKPKKPITLQKEEQVEEDDSYQKEVEEMRLVHASGASLITDALDKLHQHQILAEQKKDNSNSQGQKVNQENIKPVEAIPKKVIKNAKSEDNIPTRNIKHKGPSSEKKYLKKQLTTQNEKEQQQQQPTLLDIPGFDGDDNTTNPPSSSKSGNADKTPQQTGNTGDFNEQPASSGGHKMVKKLEDATPSEPDSQKENKTEVIPEQTTEYMDEEVFINGSESQIEEPTDITSNSDKTPESYDDYDNQQFDDEKDYGYVDESELVNEEDLIEDKNENKEIEDESNLPI